MKKILVFALVLTCMFVFLSSTVFAWDDLIRCTSHAKIGDPGDMSAAAALRFSTAGDMYDADSEKQSLADDVTGIRIPLIGTYNVIENLQAFAILPIVSNDDGTDSESGIGDLWVGAKYSVMPEGLLTVRGALDIPTGDDEKGLGNAGGFGIDIAALTEKQMDAIGLSGQLGIRYNAEDGDTKWKPGLGIYLNGAASYAVTEQIPVWAGLTYFNQGDGEFDGNEVSDSTVNWLELNVGGGVKLNDAMMLGADLDYTLVGTNTDAELGVGVFFSYHFAK